MKRVAVSGGSGFIGSAVVRELEKRNIEPIVLDRKYDIDVVKSNLWEYLQNCDGVIHLAGVLGTSELFDKPEAAVEVNVLGTLNVLQACRDMDMAYVGITMPQVWKNVYQATKRCAQDLAEVWHENFDVPVSHVRAYNAFGPGQKVHGVQKIIPTFATKAWNDQPIPIWGDGEQTVDLIYVDDVARMLCDALKFGDCQVFDAGTGIAKTVNSVAKRVIEDIESKSEIEHHPMRLGENATSIIAQGDGWHLLDWKPEFEEDKWAYTLAWYHEERP